MKGMSLCDRLVRELIQIGKWADVECFRALAARDYERSKAAGRRADLCTELCELLFEHRRRLSR